MADTSEFADTSCCRIIHSQHCLWLLWPTIQANTWENALLDYEVSTALHTAEWITQVGIPQNTGHATKPRY